jgi:hypothetical protein
VFLSQAAGVPAEHADGPVSATGRQLEIVKLGTCHILFMFDLKILVFQRALEA